MLAICNVVVVAIALGSLVFGHSTPAFASDRLFAPPQSISISIELLNTTGGRLIAQAGLTEEMEAKAKERAPQGATLDAASTAEFEFECQKEGFYPNPFDRKKFIRCVNYGEGYGMQRFDFDCAPGTDLWCQELQTCAFAFQCS